jgi:transposase
MQDTFIGIDVSKSKIDVAFMSSGKINIKEFSNSKKGYESIADVITKDHLNINLICMEATGRYSEGVAQFFFNLNFPVSIANPLQVKRFGQSALVRNKTDRADARVIAQYAEAMKPALWDPPSGERRQLKNLVRQLEHMKTQLVRENNRYLEETDIVIRKSIKRVIDCLKSEIKELQSSIDKAIKNDETMTKQKQLLVSIPGIGKETVSRLLANLEMGRFNSAKQVSAFAGLSPQQHQSGSSVRGKTRLSKQGDKKLRKALYMPAVVAIKCNPIIKIFYERLLSRGLSRKSAVCACMRKLLHIAYGVLKTQKPFSAEYLSQENAIAVALG